MELCMHMYLTKARMLIIICCVLLLFIADMHSHWDTWTYIHIHTYTHTRKYKRTATHVRAYHTHICIYARMQKH